MKSRTKSSNSLRSSRKIFCWNSWLCSLRMKNWLKLTPWNFLSKETEPSINFTNLKRVATDVWVAFAELGSESERKTLPTSLVFFYESMKYLKESSKGQTWLKKRWLCTWSASYVLQLWNARKLKTNCPNGLLLTLFRNSPIKWCSSGPELLTFSSSMVPFKTCPWKWSQKLLKASTNVWQTTIIHLSGSKQPMPLIAFETEERQIIGQTLASKHSHNLLAIAGKVWSWVFWLTPCKASLKDFQIKIGPFAVDLGKYLAKLFIKMFQRMRNVRQRRLRWRGGIGSSRLY